MPTAARDYYETLGVAKSATTTDIRTAYRSLILLHHPDKRGTAVEDDKDEHHRAASLNVAFETLVDPAKRTAYDQILRGRQAAPNDDNKDHKQSFAKVIDLSDFTPHHEHEHAHEQEQSVEDEPVYYTYRCRCSGMFVVSVEQLDKGIDVVQCDSCSERCKVEYALVSDPA